MKNTDRVIKLIVIIAIVLFGVSIFPVILASFYARPVNDDYSFSYLTFQALQAKRNVFGIIAAAMREVVNIYRNWQGTFSAIFLFSLQPGIFAGGRGYAVTTILIIAFLLTGTWCICDAAIHSWLGQSHKFSFLLAIAILLFQIQFMPSVSEGLYWYNGSCYYTGFYSLALILLSAIILELVSASRLSIARVGRAAGFSSKRICRMIFISILAFFIGGGNYTTVLVCLEMLFLLLLGVCQNGKRCLLPIVLFPLCCMLAAFCISAAAPGNRVRGNYMTGLRPFSAIIASIQYGARLFIQWSGLAQIGLFFFLIIVFCILRTRWPKNLHKLAVCDGIFIIALAFLIFSSSLTPSLFAMGNIGAGRQQDIYYYTYYWLVAVAAGTIACCLPEHLIWFCESGSQDRAHFLRVSCFILTIILALAGIRVKGFHTLTSVRAYDAYCHSDLKEYAEEYDHMIAQIAGNADEVICTGIALTPEIYVPLELTQNPDDWVNMAMARYFQKNTIRIQ